MSHVIHVTPQQVAAAKLKAKRARARGLPVDAATQAIADAAGAGKAARAPPSAVPPTVAAD